MTATFFGTEAGLFVDLFLLVQVLILPALLVAVRLVRRGRVKAHAAVMTTCFALFLLTVVAFEAQVHLGEPGPPLAVLPLVVHLAFAVPALALWIVQMALARRALTAPAGHRRRGRALIALLCCTVATGVWLYAATFV